MCQDIDQLGQLEVNATYLLEGLRVSPVRDPKWNSTGHQYELTWSPNSRMAGPLTDQPIRRRYNLFTISSLAAAALDTTVDLLAWVMNVGQLERFRSKQERDVVKREVRLADRTGEIELVLWGEQAEQWQAAQTVLVLQAASVKEYRGVKNLSLGRGGSYQLEPDCEGVAELTEWGGQQAGAGAGPLDQAAGELTTLEELRQAVERDRMERRVTLLASPTRLKTEKMWYRAHQPSIASIRCNKKVEQTQSGLYRHHALTLAAGQSIILLLQIHVVTATPRHNVDACLHQLPLRGQGDPSAGDGTPLHGEHVPG